MRVRLAVAALVAVCSSLMFLPAIYGAPKATRPAATAPSSSAPLAAESRLDCWWEEAGLFFAATADGKVVADKKGTPSPFSLDFADKRAGDLSVLYTTAKGKPALTVGFTPGNILKTWALGPQWELHLWLKTQMADAPAQWPAILTDAAGQHADGMLAAQGTDGPWTAFVLKVDALRADIGFDYAKVASCRLNVPLAEGSKVWFDDIYWSEPATKAEIGVTDKTVTQRMAEEKATHQQRVAAAFEAGAKTDFSGRDKQLYDQLFSGQNLAGANEELRAIYAEELKRCRENTADLWSLWMNPRLITAYYRLGSKGQFKPARLEPATEKALLELLWERTKDKNDIALTRWSTWWMAGSENHNLNAKASCLVTSRIFMNEPEYASRVYPDAGHGDGHGYWFHVMMMAAAGRGPDGLAHLKDGKAYTAKDHYQAWVRYFKEYFAERARKGFFLERASAGYMKWTLDFILTIYDYSGDDVLRQEVGQFLDLVWVDWAQEQIAGLRGGPKTRHHHSVGGYDSMTDMGTFYSGGPGSTNLIYSVQMASDYQWPRIVWELALDRQRLGCYAAVSRGIGEEERTRPRPAGTERSMLGNCESRLLKYSWVTPDYILGTQMDHPDAVYNHLAPVGRWEGLIVGDSPEARVVLTAGMETSAKPGARPTPDMEWVYHSVQHRNVLITQQARRWTAIHPDWFPAPDAYSKPVEVHIGKAWDVVEEKDGWVFVQKGNTYVAIRVAEGLKGERGGPLNNPSDPSPPDDSNQTVLGPKAYEWSDDHTRMKLLDKYSPVVIEAGRRADFATLADFQKAILANPLKLYKTVVPGFSIVSYRGCGPEAKELVYNAGCPTIPTIGGVPVNHAPAQLFDSPFIQSKYNSGVVTIRSGRSEAVLDFNKFAPWPAAK